MRIRYLGAGARNVRNRRANGTRTTAMWLRLASAAPFALLCAVGCGGDDRLEVSPVRGQVVYQGRGVPNATVIFYPVGEAAEKLKKMRPYAYADESGRFELKTYVTADGAPPGEYEVSIIAVSGADRESDPSSQMNSPKLPRALVQKYANQKTSGIRVTVKPGENGLEPFVLN
jgi:hypothetical protein